MFKTVWRTSIRHKQFTLLNILGLSIGITTSLMIGLYVLDELSYDNFHQNGDRIYRINQSYIWGDWNGQMPSTGPNVSVALRSDIPEFEQVTKVLPTEPFAVSYRDASNGITSFLEDRHLTVEENFFDIFSFEALQGDAATALSQPFKAVITERMATKYFGDTNPLGKTLHMKGTILEGNSAKPEEWQPFEVTAVLADVPSNSHIQFDILTSMSSYRDIKDNESIWAWTGFVNYGLLKNGVDLESLQPKLNAVPKKWAAGTLRSVFGLTFEELEADEKSWNLYLQPIEDIYLDTEVGNFLGPLGSIRHITIFSTIGLIILVLSCINFMNLSTARSSNRAKEVGIRKVLGSQRQSLARQFLFESFVYVIVSTLIGFILAEIFLNAFNDLTQKSLNLYIYLTDVKFISIVLSFILMLGLLAGTYPALYLSSFKPVDTLKGQLSSGRKGKGIRNALVMFQFTASVALIVSTSFVHKQLNYVSGLDLGYDKEHILHLHNIERLDTQVEAIKNSLAQNPAIQHIGQSHQVPPNIQRGDIIQAEGANESVQVMRMKVDEQYLDLLNPKWLAGRNFEKSRALDRQSGIIINAAAAKVLGYGLPDDFGQDSPTGKTVLRGDTKFQVIGVVDDFHYNSVKLEVRPLIIYHIANPFLPDSGTSPSVLSLRLNKQQANSAGVLKNLIDNIENELSELDASFPFEYSFMDQHFENSFRNEQRMGLILNVFTVMAIIIASLGLLGLAAFSAEQRTKEIGIRKVLGANTFSLLALVSSEFTRLVLISMLIATPIAYSLIDSWLADFAYKTPIDVWTFLLSGILAIVISWGTIGFQSLKTVRLNPAEVLKGE